MDIATETIAIDKSNEEKNKDDYMVAAAMNKAFSAFRAEHSDENFFQQFFDKIYNSESLPGIDEETQEKVQSNFEQFKDILSDFFQRLRETDKKGEEAATDWALFNQKLVKLFYDIAQGQSSQEVTKSAELFHKVINALAHTGDFQFITLRQLINGAMAQGLVLSTLKDSGCHIIVPEPDDRETVKIMDVRAKVDAIIVTPEGKIIFIDTKSRGLQQQDTSQPVDAAIKIYESRSDKYDRLIMEEVWHDLANKRQDMVAKHERLKILRSLFDHPLYRSTLSHSEKHEMDKLAKELVPIHRQIIVPTQSLQVQGGFKWPWIGESIIKQLGIAAEPMAVAA